MSLDKFTFGKTPAAIYLVNRLNELGDCNINRRISRKLNHYRSLLNDLLNSNETDNLSAHNIAFLCELITKELIENKLYCNDANYIFLDNLATNVIIGEIKSIKRRAKLVRHQEKYDLKNYTNKQLAKNINKLNINDLKDKINSDFLIERSKKYLSRHNKKDTLY